MQGLSAFSVRKILWPACRSGIKASARHAGSGLGLAMSAGPAWLHYILWPNECFSINVDRIKAQGPAEQELIIRPKRI